jgi:3-methyladenine DNA glycosylase/8-oxoguanine DNA glycosylase
MSEDITPPEQQNLDLQISDSPVQSPVEVKPAQPALVVQEQAKEQAVVSSPQSNPPEREKKFDEEIKRRLSRVDLLEDSLTALQNQSEALRARLDKEILNQRINWAVNQGIKGLSRADLGAIMPDVDPSTPEGMAALDAWKQERPEIFPVSDLPKQRSADSILANVEDRPNHFWSANKMREIATNGMGKG